MAAHYSIQFLSAVPVRRSGSMAAPSPLSSGELSALKESTKEIQYVKTREARTKESTQFKKTEENTKKRTQYQEHAGHYSACSSRRPSPPSLLPRCPNCPPPVEPPFRHIRCFARSRTAGLHLSVAHAPLLLPLFVASFALTHTTACWSFHLQQCLNRWPLVWRVPLSFSGSNHQQWLSGLFSVLSKYTPGLEPVEPRGRPLLRSGWYRIGFAIFFRRT